MMEDIAIFHNWENLKMFVEMILELILKSRNIVLIKISKMLFLIFDILALRFATVQVENTCLNLKNTRREGRDRERTESGWDSKNTCSSGMPILSTSLLYAGLLTDFVSVIVCVMSHNNLRIFRKFLREMLNLILKNNLLLSLKYFF